MKIKPLLLTAGFIWFNSFLFGQTNDSTPIHRDRFSTYDELRKKIKEIGSDTITYFDSTFGYEVKIPAWMHLRETSKPTEIGGVLPAVNGIENAIAISGFPKTIFLSFNEFKEIYLTGNTFGKPTKYSSQTIWYGHDNKGVTEIPHGVKERVFTLWQNHIYYNMFVLLETKTAYLFVRFTATQDTYDFNLPKFEEFMTGLKIF